MEPGVFVTLIFGIFTSFLPTGLIAQNCVLNGSWTGDWVEGRLEDRSQPATITSNTFSGKGVCIDSMKDKYLFKYEHEKETCFKCLVIFQPHHNVLQYKESMEYCENQGALEMICDQIDSDIPLNSLFRKNADLVKCPFVSSQYTFSYSKRGKAACEDPLSKIHTCLQPTKMMFIYNACPDKSETGHAHIEVHCIASWKENFGNNEYVVVKEISHFSYLYGGNFRCYQYQSIWRNGSDSEIAGYKVYSLDELGSCSHVTDSPNTLELKVAPKPKACSFPSWMLVREWLVLNRTISVLTSENNTLLKIVQNPRNSTSPYLHLTCDNVEHDSGLTATIRVNETMGCKILTICMEVKKRSENVLELELHRTRSLQHGESCTDALSIGSHSTTPEHSLYYTLIDWEASAVDCPFQEEFHVSEVRQDDGKLIMDKCEAGKAPESFSVVQIGVGTNRTYLKFFSHCDGQKTTLYANMYCAAAWRDMNKEYVIAGNRGFLVAGYRCFEFIETLSGFNVSMRMNDCKPSPFSHLAQQTFKLIKPGLDTGPSGVNSHAGSQDLHAERSGSGSSIANLYTTFILVLCVLVRLGYF